MTHRRRTDAEIHRAVLQELHWDTQIDEKQAILGAVGFAPGVLQVEDHLRIDPDF
ncbi:MAG TPA: hypothetical protein VFB21_17755 [Chthonomonadaceae bacterium]|nr:hypothetical protein [Chthonomonadaceae bacterium]